MHVRSIIKQAQGLMTTNAPAILTGLGVVGVVGTAYLTGKATFKAADVLRMEKRELNIIDNEPLEADRDLGLKRNLQLVWTLYLPAAGVASSTIVAIIYANRINAKRMAALLTAYTALDKGYSEYKDKVKEHLTGPKEQKLRSEISQDRINREFDGTYEEVFSPLDGKVLIMEEYTGRFFWSSIDAIEKAVNEVNALVLKEGSCRLSDFYDTIGLTHVSTSDYFGFTREDMLEVNWNTGTTPDGKTAVHCFDYVNHPVQNPEREANPFR